MPCDGAEISSPSTPQEDTPYQASSQPQCHFNRHKHALPNPLLSHALSNNSLTTSADSQVKSKHCRNYICILLCVYVCMYFHYHSLHYNTSPTHLITAQFQCTHSELLKLCWYTKKMFPLVSDNTCLKKKEDHTDPNSISTHIRTLHH